MTAQQTLIKALDSSGAQVIGVGLNQLLHRLHFTVCSHFGTKVADVDETIRTFLVAFLEALEEHSQAAVASFNQLPPRTFTDVATTVNQWYSNAIIYGHLDRATTVELVQDQALIIDALCTAHELHMLQLLEAAQAA